MLACFPAGRGDPANRGGLFLNCLVPASITTKYVLSPY